MVVSSHCMNRPFIYKYIFIYIFKYTKTQTEIKWDTNIRPMAMWKLDVWISKNVFVWITHDGKQQFRVKSRSPVCADDLPMKVFLMAFHAGILCSLWLPNGIEREAREREEIYSQQIYGAYRIDASFFYRHKSSCYLNINS